MSSALALKHNQGISHAGSNIDLPPCPAVLTRLLRETRADEPDFRRVGQLIQYDVALAAAVVSLANSSYYGLRNKVTSVQQAVTTLGLNAVPLCITGMLLKGAFPAATSKGMGRYWKSSMTIAQIASMISRHTGCGRGEISHTYALFRNARDAGDVAEVPDLRRYFR